MRDGDLRERETETLRRMTPARKLAVMHALIREASQLAAAGERARRPDLTERRSALGSGAVRR